MGHLPDLAQSVYSSVIGFASYRSDLFLLIIVPLFIYSIRRNRAKKILFFTLFLAGSASVYDRGWYVNEMDRFQGLFWGCCFCMWLLFFAYERLLKILNENCKYAENKVWLTSNSEHRKGFYGFFSDIKDWIFLDNDEYKNTTSVKSRVLIRSLHNFTFLAFLSLLSTLFLDLKDVRSSNLVYLIPIFFVIYQYNSNQHWNQWKYCVDLYNSIKIREPDCDEKRYALALDMIVLEMWSNRTLYDFFKYSLESAASEPEEWDFARMTSIQAWNLLSAAHKEAVKKQRT